MAEPAPPLPRPRAASFLLALAALFPVGLAAQALSPAAGLTWTQLFVFALPAAALVARRGLSPAHFLRLQAAPGRALALAVPVGAAALLVGGALQALWSTLLPGALLQAFDVGRLFRQPPLAQVVVVLAATALAPVCEELAFRGHLLSALRLRFGPAAAVALSAVAFAGWHLDPVRLPGLLFLGLLYGWLSWRSGSVWPSVVAHAVNNAAATALAMQQGSGPALEEVERGPAALALAFGAALLALLVQAFHRATPAPPPPEQVLSPGRWSAGRWPRWALLAALLAAGSLALLALAARR